MYNPLIFESKDERDKYPAKKGDICIIKNTDELYMFNVGWDEISFDPDLPIELYEELRDE